MQLDFTLAITDNDWYPTAELSDFKTQSGNIPDIQDRMMLVFTGPGKMTAGDVSIECRSWINFDIMVEATEVGGGEFDTLVVITAPNGEIIGSNIEKVHLGLNKSSDTAPEWSSFAGTFVAAADEMPNIKGSLSVACDAAPAQLADASLELVLTHGENSHRMDVVCGKVQAFELPFGVYQVSANALVNADATRRANTLVSLSQIEIKQGSTSSLHIGFGAVEASTTLDLNLDFSEFADLEGEDLEVYYFENNIEKLRFIMRSGEEKRLEGLPVSGKFRLYIPALRLNNRHYDFPAMDGLLDGTLHRAVLVSGQVKMMMEDVTGAQPLTIQVAAENAVPGKKISLRITEESVTAPRNYRFDGIVAQNGSVQSRDAIVPGHYSVAAQTFIEDATLHYVESAPQLVVTQGQAARLDVSIVTGADLRVKGFPEFLTFGGCANMSPTNVDDFATARISSIFKYSGDDGMGDAGDFLDPAKEPTLQVINMARDVSAKLGGESVLPMMVSYTCNLSLGDVLNIIKDPERHMYSFANFIQALQMAQGMKDEQHPVPAGFIVNPDYLGECQKTGLLPTHAIPVRQPLAEALAHHNIDIEVPAAITDTLKGYIMGVNWLVRAVAPDVVLGWQVNLWGVGGSQWVYSDFEYETAFNPATQQMERMNYTPALAGQKTAEYALLVGVFDEIPWNNNGQACVAKGADFMAVDRYEADDFTIRSWANGYCYSPYEWDRTFDFCAAVSRHLRMPVLPWQFPASHLATEADAVADDFNDQHWGSGGSYILGHPEVGSDVNAINPKLLDMAFNPSFEDMMTGSPRALFGRTTWDITEPRYVDFPAMGIFHVQLGGGATTGVVSAVGDTSGWVRNKLKAYRNTPVAFKDKK